MSDAKLGRIALIGLRWALGTAFLSAVASRLGLLGSAGGDWHSFLKYAAQVNWYLPPSLVPAVAVAATILESTFGCLLIVGWQVRYVAFGSAGLLMMFALAMASGEPRSPFDYSVFTASFGTLTVATTYEKGKAK
jgi:putative oxidoreductase